VIGPARDRNLVAGIRLAHRIPNRPARRCGTIADIRAGG
jgi:hypothetical protein